MKIFIYIAILSTFLFGCTSDNITQPQDYPQTTEFNANLEKIRSRGIEIHDMHIHLRGGVTPEIAVARELKTGIKSAVLDNHGKGWTFENDEQLLTFLKWAKTPKIAGKSMLVGIQVNDRDWYKQISSDVLKQFDFILSDAFIMRNPDGTFTKIWLLENIPNYKEWFKEYFQHNMNLLDEPITIFANPTYLPPCIADKYDELWTDEYLEMFIKKAVQKNIVLEIQAGSPFQANTRFMRVAKKYGVKFSFGTNNRDGAVKPLDSWTKAVEIGNLQPADFWNPPVRN